MSLDALTPEVLLKFFSKNTYANGLEYFKRGKVEKIHLEHNPAKGETSITASVQGRERYNVQIDLGLTNRRDEFSADCNCPSDYYCKHIVATLLEAQSLNQLSHQDITEKNALHWVTLLENNLNASLAKEMCTVDQSYELYFMLHTSKVAIKNECIIETCLLRRLKNGKIGSKKNFSVHNSSTKKHVLPNEELLLAQLLTINQLQNEYSYHYYHNTPTFKLKGAIGQELLPALLATGKCIQEQEKDIPLTLGEPVPLTFHWKKTSSGSQQLKIKTNIKKPIFFFIEGLWYLDQDQHKIGQVQTTLSNQVLNNLMSAPEIPASLVPKLNNVMQKQSLLRSLPRLKNVLPEGVIKCKPIPCLRLSMHSLTSKNNQPQSIAEKNNNLPVAELNFQYQDSMISWHAPDPVITQNNSDNSVNIARDFDAEAMAIDTLHHHSLKIIETNAQLAFNNTDIQHLFYFANINPLTFTKDNLNPLREAGWHIEMDEHYEFQLVDLDMNDTEWFANVEEGETSDWFSLELGITVNGDKINLLPVIANLLSTIKHVNELEKLSETDHFAPLPNGKFIAISGKRLQLILKSLVELFDYQSLDANQLLRLSKCQAARLAEIEKASGAAALRWHGGEKLRVLGQKISEFKNIESAPVPTTFKGTLRAYQHEGLSWLQFLREYELGGILADDMGLGKTIQTLTHILLEKESGRMILPTLVIAPTSLMYNWEKEAQTFAPSLKVCTLQGTDRKQYFDNLQSYDLILTTYSVILRDKEALLKQRFHLLILDEAQYIKNNKNLATQIVIQLQANHRLCLTGTPMENHLGELWSLYHFLMPGFLGDTKFFTRFFRTPIEKNADNERRQALNRRLAPFLLRRTKDAVVKELPAKTEIIQYVELDSGQRDLYETIRIAMEEKVRKEVEKLGLSRSHIVILDALLKLRQVACDPRLLKVDSPIKKTALSAKMDWLAERLPELIEEGRRILLFSAFTEMLALIEDMVNKANIPYVILTGKTKDRKTPIDKFQAGEIPLFLISLKAGGTGLNLTAADTVIIFDPWWNPAAEKQATDRAHRIGQDKPVFVYKIITKGTVEEKIISLQEKKQALADGLYTDKSTKTANITEQDLRALFEPL